MALKGDGVFSGSDADFARFLSDTGSSSDDTQAFVARNFLLDEAVPAARADSYAASGGATAHADSAAWLKAHNHYLTARVWSLSHDHGPPALVDTADEEGCPETFRLPAASPYAAANGTLDLVRVEGVTFIASKSASDPAEVVRLARAALAPGAGDDTRAALDALLEVWSRKIDLRPVFAGFWEDVQDLFGATPDADPPGWADRLRDRLGLLHHDPADKKGPIDVLVFRYQVDAVPPLASDHARRPLLPPTVLDGRHSAAFCPAPRDSATGHTIDLGARGERPCREVLHPCTALRARHVFRVGTISAPVARERLREARGMHLLAVRDQAGRPDYAAGTDGDLA